MKERIVVGVDLGGTFIKFGMFQTSGKLLKKWQVPTDNSGPEATLAQIASEVVKSCQAEGYQQDRIEGVGIGVPGSVDRHGMLISAPNLGWSMLDVRQEMKKHLDLPVAIANDANVAALGEQYFGAGEGCDSMVMITLGTGVGGGVIINQRLVAGAFGGAGEIGHLVMNDAETVPCTCGNRGCLEQYASATGIARVARTLLEEKMAANGGKQVSGLQAYDTITAKEVFDEVKAGDELAMEVAEQFGRTLGKALSYVASVVDPEMFVIGGGVSAAGEVLLHYMEKYYSSYAFAPSKHTPIRLARLGNDAGIYGAARLILLQ